MNIGGHSIGPGAPGPVMDVLRAIDARYVVAVNFPELCQQADASGIIPIFRVNGSGDARDDDGDSHLNPANYIQSGLNQLAAWGVKRRWLNYGNELGVSTPERTAKWFMDGILKAAPLSVTLVMGNWYMQGPTPGYFEHPAWKPVLKKMADTGMVMGFHRGATPTLDTFDKSLAGGGIGGFEKLQKDYPGIRVAITEFGATKNNRGYRTWYGDRYAELLKQAYEYYGEHGVLFMSHFTVEPWSVSPGFELAGNTDLIKSMRTINQEVIVVTPTTVPAPTSGGVRSVLKKLPGDFINLRAQPDKGSADLGDLKLNQVVTVYPDAPSDGWVFVDTGSAKGWVSLQAGAVVFSPMVDPPPIPPPPAVFTPEQIVAIKALAREVVDEIAKGAGF